MPKRRVQRHAVTQPPDQSYRLIPLTQGRNAIVDAADYDWLSQWNWRTTWNAVNGTYYAVRSNHGEKYRAKHRKNILMHREILKCVQDIDHRNRNGLDNRRQNLRKCRPSQNNCNAKLSKRNKTGFRGVYWAKKDERFIAMIRLQRRGINLGSFHRAEDAARAYDEAARKLHGEFAFLNFP